MITKSNNLLKCTLLGTLKKTKWTFEFVVVWSLLYQAPYLKPKTIKAREMVTKNYLINLSRVGFHVESGTGEVYQLKMGFGLPKNETCIPPIINEHYQPWLHIEIGPKSPGTTNYFESEKNINNLYFERNWRRVRKWRPLIYLIDNVLEQ